MTSEPFQLLWDTDHLLKTDDQFDLVLERTSEHEGVPSHWPTDPDKVDLPDPIVFAANFGDITYTDYPSNDQSWPIMSKKMLDTLLGVGKFKHRVIPVSIVDPIVYTQEEHEQATILLEKRLAKANHDYVIVQLTEQVELDEEASGVERDEDLPWMVEVEKYVFKVPTEQLPPIFRLSIDSSQLYISAAARAALKVAGVRGPRYLPMEGYVNGGGDEVDVPVPQPTIAD